MDDTKIKEAFAHAKQDIEELRANILYLADQIEEVKRTLQQTNTQTNQQTEDSTYSSEFSTNQHTTKTDNPTHYNIPTDKLPLYTPKEQNMSFSTGNKGVPTDRQTNQQTDRQEISGSKIAQQPTTNTLNRISQAFDSLDEFKQNLRRQCKSLTAQEFLIFSTIYQFEEEGRIVDYPILASRLKLSESSIRDYTLKIVRKGLPIQKTKHNNKKVTLSVAPELKKIASLKAILTLREL
jgi:hypothetical protein